MYLVDATAISASDRTRVIEIVSRTLSSCSAARCTLCGSDQFVIVGSVP